MPEHDLAVLQAVRLKGRATPEDVAAATGIDASATLTSLVAAELCTEKNGRYRMTPAGREQLAALLDAERASVDTAAFEALYEEFDAFNTRFKQLASDWQQRDGAPNDHSDAAYDGAILERLGELDRDFQSLAARLAAAAVRLAPYPGRFTAALAKVRDGDHAWFLRPGIDSYHTVWFELHEDLIGLAGRTRADEAAAGRAQ